MKFVSMRAIQFAAGAAILGFAAFNAMPQAAAQDGWVTL
jgi:hypothetical protein